MRGGGAMLRNPHSIQSCPMYAKSVASPTTLLPIETDQQSSAERPTYLPLHKARAAAAIGKIKKVRIR